LIPKDKNKYKQIASEVINLQRSIMTLTKDFLDASNRSDHIINPKTVLPRMGIVDIFQIKAENVSIPSWKYTCIFKICQKIDGLML